VAASKAGISVSIAGRIENDRHQTKKDKREWRIRADPLEPVWDSVVLPLLLQDNEISPVGILINFAIGLGTQNISVNQNSMTLCFLSTFI
jgi:hypothetical protein